MASWAKKELAPRLKFFKSNDGLLLPPPPNFQPSTIPQVKEVVLSADLRCATCQNMVADAISTIVDIESIVVHVQEKKVTLTRKSAGKCPSTKLAAIYKHLAAAGRPSKAPLFSFHL